MDGPKPSKSERKREQQELQALGERLAGLPDALRRKLPLGDRLQDALDELQRMKAHEAIRRQKQFIGRLMRDVDPAPIRALFAERAAGDQRDKRLFSSAERWRDRFVREGRDALAPFLAETGSAATGADADGIGRILDALASSPGERAERRLRRELFREVHAKLVAGAPDG